jgi:hypothetical protein
MDNNLHALTNRHQDVRLISLRKRKHEGLVEPHDDGGPYIVAQEGYDPEDVSASPDNFVLGKSGAWLSVGLFLKLPRETRRQEFVFGTAAEVIALLEGLVGKAHIIRAGHELATPARAAQPDEVTAAFTDQQSKR